MIDWKQVQNLKADVGAEEFDEVIELFFAEVEEGIERLGGVTDPAACADELHFLKGAAMNLGFDALSVQCQEGEKALRSTAAALPDVARLSALYGESKQRFLSDMPDQM